AKHGLLKVGGEPSSPPTPPQRLFPRELVDEQVVHHGARVVLAERLGGRVRRVHVDDRHAVVLAAHPRVDVAHERVDLLPVGLAHDLRDHAVDRKSTRLNSSHVSISYAVFCLKKKKKKKKVKNINKYKKKLC